MASFDASTTDANTLDAGDLPVSPATFAFTGAVESWEVPTGVTSITIEARGAAGGDGFNADQVETLKGPAGEGGVVTATIAVTAGETLSIHVGGKGANALALTPGLGGFNGGGDGADSLANPNYYGGGGGGASDVRLGGSTLADRVVVAEELRGSDVAATILHMASGNVMTAKELMLTELYKGAASIGDQWSSMADADNQAEQDMLAALWNDCLVEIDKVMQAPDGDAFDDAAEFLERSFESEH